MFTKSCRIYQTTPFEKTMKFYFTQYLRHALHVQLLFVPVKGHVFERERAELKEKYEEQIAALHQELELLREKLEEEREALAQRYEMEKDSMEDQLAQQIREELEV